MTFTVRAELSEADYIAAQRLHRRRSLWLTIAGVVLAAVLAWIAIRSFKRGDLFGLCLSLGALGGGLAGGLISHYLWIPWQARRVFRKQKSMQRPFELSWDAAGLHAKDGNGEYRHAWSDFVRWREGERLFVLSLSDAMFIMVPKRAFTEQQSLEAFRESVSSRIAGKR